MFDDVEKEDLIELRDVYREFFPIKIPSDKIDLLRPLGRMRHIPVHPGDAATSPDQFGRDVPLAATNIENMPAGTRCGDSSGVRGFVSELQIVGFLRRIDVELPVEKQIHLMTARAEHCSKNVCRVFQSIHVADFAAVKCRDRQLDDPQFLQHELNDDLGVEMEIVRVALKRNLNKRASR